MTHFYRQGVANPTPTTQEQLGRPTIAITSYDPSFYQAAPLQVVRWRRGDRFTNPKFRVMQEPHPEQVWAEARQLDIRSGNQNPSQQGISFQGVQSRIRPKKALYINGLGLVMPGVATAAKEAAKTVDNVAPAVVTTTAKKVATEAIDVSIQTISRATTQELEKTAELIAKQEGFLRRLFYFPKNGFEKSKELFTKHPYISSVSGLLILGGGFYLIGSFFFGKTLGIPNYIFYPAVGYLAFTYYDKEIKKRLKK